MNINRVVITGNLTADPDLRNLPSGTALCRLRVACNTRRKQQDGSWGEKPNYFDVTVWGAQGENVARYLRRGSAIAIDGRLEWREWTAESGEKRQAVEIVADTVQFLDTATSKPNARGSGSHPSESRQPAPTAPPVGDDDIPF